MKINKQKILNLLKESLYFIAAFILPFILLIIIFTTNGFSLNSLSGKTIISIDFQSQYIAYLRYYREMLINDGFINVYTLSKTFGGDFMSIFTYYLASPFNLLLPLVKESQIPLLILWINIIKMSLASLTMYILLRVSLNKNRIINIAISLSYGLLVYGFVYNSNFMWLDGVMILPLIILGLKLLVKDKNPTLYIFALAYAFLTSWYIGALLTIFVILFFIVEFFSDERKLKDKYKVIIKFAVFSVISALICSPNWLTAFSHFAGTKASAAYPPTGWLPITMFFTGMLENGYESSSSITMNTGYMPIFVSIGVLALMVMYFFSKGYSLKQRLLHLAIFVFYYIFSSINTLNALLHGGREPTWFPARFAFCISFFICYLAALGYEKKKEIPIYGILSPLALASLVIPFVLLVPNSSSLSFEQTYKLSLISLLIYVLVVVLLLLEKFLPKKIAEHKTVQPILSGVLLVLLTLSAYRGGDNVIRNNVSQPNYYQSYKTYLEDDSHSDVINEDYNSTYRTATSFLRMGSYNQIDNNPMFYGFNGLSHYSSTNKQNVDNYLRKLGFHYNGYFAKYDGGSTLSINSLLGVKTIYTNYDYNLYFLNSPGIESKNLKFYKKHTNSYALPLAFYSEATSGTYIAEGKKIDGKESTYWFDDFEYQNQIFKTLSGLDEDIFTALPIKKISTENLDFQEDEHGFRRYTSQENKKSKIIVTYERQETIDEYHNLYFSEKSGIDLSVYSSGYYGSANAIDISNYWHKGIRSLQPKNINFQITLTISNQINNQLIRPSLYVEDVTVLNKHLNLIRAKNLEFEVSKDIFSTSYKGSFEYDGNKDDLVFTLPYEKQFQVKIDGKKVETKTRLNVFTAVDISNLSIGEHTVEIKYVDTAYKAGSGLCLTGIIISSFVCVYYCLNEETREKLKNKINFSKKKK